MKFEKSFKIMVLLAFSVSVSATASNATVYALPDAKSFGVASEDQKGLMFLGMDRNADLKGVCFAMLKQAESNIPYADVIATTNNKDFRMHGLRPNIRDNTKEVVCSFGSDAFDYLDNLSKSSMSLVSIRFNGELRNFSFNTSSFSKLLTPNGAKIAEQAADDYKRGIRAPVFYNKAPSSVTENEDRYALSDQKLNEIWNKLPSETRRKLLPSQREWIKQKDTCRRDTECLTDMTNKRIKILEMAR